MKKTRATCVGALLAGLALIGAACTSDSGETASTQVPTSSLAPATNTSAANGELEGLKGVTPSGADVSAVWLESLSAFWEEKGNATLSNFSYAAEAYDAVVVIALAVEKAGTDGAAHANEIVGITKEGTKCTTFANCLQIIKDGGDPNYDGISGPLDFFGNGEPSTGSFAEQVFGTDNRLDPSLEALRTIEAPSAQVVEVGSTSSTRVGDGILKIGSLLSETGTYESFGPPEFAGLEFAIAEINATGGVLGQPIEYSSGNSGDTSTDIANTTVDRLISENVDAIIGATSSGVTLTVIDKIVAAGITMYSPSNTSPALSDYPDDFLYFRNAPSDLLLGALLAQLITSDGNSSVYIFNLDDTYGNGLANAVAASLENSGVQILGQKAYDRTSANFDAEIAKILAADPASIVLITLGEGSRILRGLVDAGLGPKVKLIYGVFGNISNAIGENFDTGN